LTGRENVVLGGIIAGLTRRQVLERMDDIIDFAELREFIDTPVRAYSSGMLLRLAFSIVVNTNPEILLIDEVLAVGDQTFRAKCLSRVEDFRRAGCAILLVTHDTRLAAQVCDVVMWLSKGRSVMVGPGQKVVAAYEESMNWETKRRTPADWRDEVSSSGIELRMMDNRFGSMEVQITDVRLIDPRGHRSQRVHPGEGLRVEVDYWCERPQPAPNFGVIIRQENNTVLFDATMPASELGLEAIQGNGSVAITFDRLDLNSGEYHIDVGIYRQDWAYAYDYHWRAYPLMVVAANLVKGAVNPPHAWERSVPRSARVR
jgi:lipopolysaccharide transport system ATP-binding protein